MAERFNEFERTIQLLRGKQLPKAMIGSRARLFQEINPPTLTECQRLEMGVRAEARTPSKIIAAVHAALGRFPVRRTAGSRLERGSHMNFFIVGAGTCIRTRSGTLGSLINLIQSGWPEPDASYARIRIRDSLS